MTAIVVAPCAGRCGLVAYLLTEIARARGTNEDVQRITYGIPGAEDRRPVDR